jgi:acyl carrier protein
MTTRTIITDFIVGSLLVGKEATTVDPDESLTTSGLIDSLGMLRLITFLEQQFGIEIGDGEVGEENFGTLGRVAAFVERKQAS